MNLRITFSLFFLFISMASLNARHLLGGTASYEVKEKGATNSIVNMEFTLFRDALTGGANFDNNAQFGVFGFSNNEYTYLETIVVTFQDIETLDFNFPDDCPQIQYQQASYAFEVSLPNTTYDHYIVSYQRCCRSVTISNIIDPDEYGFALSVTLYPAAFDFVEKAKSINTSNIPFLLQSQETYLIDLGINDDYTKEYKLTPPKTAGGIAGVIDGSPLDCNGITPDPEYCLPPFDNVIFVDPDNHYGVNSQVSIDDANGELDFYIPINGNTVFEVTIDRSVNDILVSSINNQWTTLTSICEVISSISAESTFAEAVIFPNPAIHSISVSQDTEDVFIIDGLGRQLIHRKKVMKDEIISIAHLNPGLYILEGTHKNGKRIKKQFVKTK